MPIYAKKRSFIAAFLCSSAIMFSPASIAVDTIEEKNIGMELAKDIAIESILACREKGYSVSAVVVDRHGNQRVAIRDDFASRFTLQIAEEKANSTILSGLKSGAFRQLREDIRPELNHVDDMLIMVGALPIISGGVRIGAVGVSGAPGGEKDEACAQQALDKFEERLAF